MMKRGMVWIAAVLLVCLLVFPGDSTAGDATEVTAALELPVDGDYEVQSVEFVPGSSRLLVCYCFDRSRGELWSVDLKTREKLRLFAPRRKPTDLLPLFMLSVPCASPDGRWVAFSMNMESVKPFQRDVFVVDTQTLKSRNLTHSPATSEHCLGWSPDGSKLVLGITDCFEGRFITSAFLVTVDGGKKIGVKRIVPGDPGQSARDGKVLFVEQNTDGNDRKSLVARVWDFSQGRQESLPPRQLKHDLGPPVYFYLPHINSVVTNLPEGGSSQAFLIGLSGDREEKIADGRVLGVSADGTKMVWTRSEQNQRRYYLGSIPASAEWGWSR